MSSTRRTQRHPLQQPNHQEPSTTTTSSTATYSYRQRRALLKFAPPSAAPQESHQIAPPPTQITSKPPHIDNNATKKLEKRPLRMTRQRRTNEGVNVGNELLAKNDNQPSLPGFVSAKLHKRTSNDSETSDTRPTKRKRTSPSVSPVDSIDSERKTSRASRAGSTVNTGQKTLGARRRYRISKENSEAVDDAVVRNVNGGTAGPMFSVPRLATKVSDAKEKDNEISTTTKSIVSVNTPGKVRKMTDLKFTFTNSPLKSVARSANNVAMPHENTAKLDVVVERKDEAIKEVKQTKHLEFAVPEAPIAPTTTSIPSFPNPSTSNMVTRSMSTVSLFPSSTTTSPVKEPEQNSQAVNASLELKVSNQTPIPPQSEQTDTPQENISLLIESTAEYASNSATKRSGLNTNSGIVATADVFVEPELVIPFSTQPVEYVERYPQPGLAIPQPLQPQVNNQIHETQYSQYYSGLSGEFVLEAVNMWEQEEQTRLARQNEVAVNVVDETRTQRNVTQKPQQYVGNAITDDENVDDIGVPLTSLDLPERVMQVYHDASITHLYSWQAECLSTTSVLSTPPSNLLYAAPTSAGKTLVAELVVLKRILENRKKAVIILPFVSIVGEKVRHLKQLWKPLGIRITGYYGNEGGSNVLEDVDLAICTIEKANGIMNRLMEEGLLGNVGVVVVDEMHMIGDEHRGYLLELLLTKLLYVAKDEIQIVGMSATLPNIDELALWLQATLYITDFRPVPLTEYVVNSGTVYDKSFNEFRTVQGPKRKRDPDNVVNLVMETVLENHSVLIFCSTKDNCEHTSRMIFECLVSDSVDNQIRTDAATVTARQEILNELARTPGGLDPVLADLVQFGIGFHHSGLTVDEREIIEDGFRAGYIRILAATSTLAYGVNLPARTVIFRQPYIAREFLDAQAYQQMKGRAGRKGQDIFGESFLMFDSKDKLKVQQLISASLKPVYSCLTRERRGMKRALLEVIAGKVVQTDVDVRRYVAQTLLAAQQRQDGSLLEKTVVEAMEFLITSRLVERKSVADGAVIYQATKLGIATVASSLAPEEAIYVFEDLQKAMKHFVLENELHIIYLVTPVYFLPEPDWREFVNIIPESAWTIAQAIGIENEGYLMRWSMRPPGKTEKNVEMVRIHKRFFAALVLNEILQEVDFRHIMTKYRINRGTIQSLQSQAATFGGMVTIFAEKLGWNNMKLLLEQFHERLNFGVKTELCTLMKIPNIKANRARVLWQAGYRTIAALACATPQEIFTHLSRSQPFKITKDISTEYQNRIEMRISHLIVRGARELLAKEQDDLKKSMERIQHQLQPVKRSLHRQLQPVDVEKLQESCSQTVVMTSQQDGSIRKVEIVRVAEHQSVFTKFINDAMTKTKWVFQGLVTMKNGHEPCFLGMAFCWDPNTTYYVDFEKPGSKYDWAALKALFANTHATKIIFDAKTQVKNLLQNQIRVGSKDLMDPKLAAWCLNPEGQVRNLAGMAQQYIPSANYDQSGTKAEVCCREAIQTWLLMDYFEDKLKKEDLYGHFSVVEMPLVPVLASMELAGVGFVIKNFEIFWQVYRRQLEYLEREAYRLAGREFSLTRPEEIAKILFDELGLECDQERHAKQLTLKSGKMVVRRSTKKEVLLKLKDKHPLPAVIMEYRRLSAIVSKHLFPLQTSKVWNPTFNMHRVHCRYDVFTATGRITTSDPNLQNVPHPRVFEHVDSANLTVDNVNIREAFEAGEGNVLVSADYSQIELRVITHYSKDPLLIKILSEGGDLFISIAAEWKRKTRDSVTDEERKAAKAICYAICYGMGANALSEELGASVEEAEAFIASFWNTFPGIVALKENIVRECEQKGYVETLSGRKRYLPNIHSTNLGLRSQAQRQAINTTIQGSAADLVKIAMINIQETLYERFGKLYSQTNQPTPDPKTVPYVILQIHDELLFELPKPLLPEVQDIVRHCMMNALHLDVPLVVKVKAGESWGNLVEI